MWGGMWLSNWTGLVTVILLHRRKTVTVTTIMATMLLVPCDTHGPVCTMLQKAFLLTSSSCTLTSLCIIGIIAPLHIWGNRGRDQSSWNNSKSTSNSKNKTVKQILFSIRESPGGSYRGRRELQESSNELERWERGFTGSPQRQQENGIGFCHSQLDWEHSLPASLTIGGKQPVGKRIFFGE